METEAALFHSYSKEKAPSKVVGSRLQDRWSFFSGFSFLGVDKKKEFLVILFLQKFSFSSYSSSLLPKYKDVRVERREDNEPTRLRNHPLQDYQYENWVNLIKSYSFKYFQLLL